MLRIFDIANPDTAVHVRSQTTVPQQSLAVLNSPLVVEAARRLAERAATADNPSAPSSDTDRQSTDAAFVQRLWRAALSRNPREDEAAAATAWLATEAAAEIPGGASAEPSFDRYDRLAQAVLATAEFQFVD